jgi:hypothetical protein
MGLTFTSLIIAFTMAKEENPERVKLPREYEQPSN